MVAQRLSRKDSQEVTRARLRRSAIASFARNGIAGSRIDAIAEAAGYSRGAFYSNYRTKLDLLVDLLREKQIGEIQHWQEVISHTIDIGADLTRLSERYDAFTNAHDRSMLNTELQLEADRNETFRPIFQTYLDNVYAEMRRLFMMMFERHGKRPPENFDAILVTTRLLGLALGSPSVLGNAIGGQTTPGRIMFEFLHGVMLSAPSTDKIGISIERGS